MALFTRISCIRGRLTKARNVPTVFSQLSRSYTVGDSAPVLVTGAAGYIGSHVVRQLLQTGYNVRGTVRSLDNKEKLQPLLDLQEFGQLELVEADLIDAGTWPEAVAGCRYVQHVASPFPDTQPRNENVLIKPAVEGTLNVLRACRDTGHVKRVVLTSSGVAIFGNRHRPAGKIFTEDDWTDPTRDIAPYAKSKTLAEKAAWDFVKSLDGRERFELAVINPVFVLGPAICGSPGTSMKIIQMILERKWTRVPRLHMATVDVRDVATAHVAAMISPDAANRRHLVSTESLWVKDIGNILAKEFKGMGYDPPTVEAANWMMYMVGLADRGMRANLPLLNKELRVDNGRFKNSLLINPYPLEKSIVDMAYNMIEKGVVEKKPGYKLKEGCTTCSGK